jgi:hypothetical protein
LAVASVRGIASPRRQHRERSESGEASLKASQVVLIKPENISHKPLGADLAELKDVKAAGTEKK